MMIIIGSVYASDNGDLSNESETLTLQEEVNVVEVDSNSDMPNAVEDTVNNKAYKSDDENILGNDIDSKDIASANEEVVIKNISVDKQVVYGKDLSVNVKGNIATEDDAKLYNVVVGISHIGISATNTTVLSDDGSFSLNLDLGIIPVNNYQLLVNVYKDEGNIFSQTFDNIVHVVPDNVTADVDDLNVVYGMGDSIMINGSIVNDGAGVNWTGLVNVTIGDYKYDFINVKDGRFQINVDNIKSYKAGNYTITVKDASGNENYTFKQDMFSFENKLTINKANVSGSLKEINITYGDYSLIKVQGNISNSTYGVKYNGKINATVGNRTYNNIDVINGNFTVNIENIADYDSGNYTVRIVEAETNENYTFKEFIFENSIIINKRTIEIYNVTVKSIEYRSTDIVYVTGNVNKTQYGKDYKGIITVTIGGKTNYGQADNGKFNITIEGVGRFNVGNYTVTVKGSDTTHYNEIAPNNDTQLEVKPTTVSIKNITVEKVVYGKNRTVDVRGFVNNNMANLGNYTGDIYINVMDYNIANRGKVQDDGSFTLNLKLDNTILPVNNYSLLVTLLGDENYRITSEIFKNILSVIPDNVTVDINNSNVSYSIADTVIVEGRVINDGFGVNWSGQVNVTIGDYKYDLINVHDGKFQVKVDNIKSYKAGNYTITVKDASGNENYTFKQETFEFENKLIINKANVSVNLNNKTCTYGNASWIELTGNITNPVSGLNYTGRINVTIKNYRYSNVEVVNGILKINITNIAKYDAGNYTVSIIEAENSENYTFNESIFENALIINKRTIELYNISVEPIQYGSVDATYVTGNVNTTIYGDNYDGIIMISINGIRKPTLTREGKFNVSFEGIGRLNVGNYTVTVEGQETTNFNKIAPNNDTQLEVKPTTVSIKNITVEKVVYGKNRMAEVIGVIDNLDHVINYTGGIALFFMGNSITVNVSENGSFIVPISLDVLPVNNYSMFITIIGNNNYKTSTQTFTNALSVIPDNVTVSVDDINVSYGMADSITVNGRVINDGFGVNWTGKVNVTIGDIEYNNIPVNDGKFQIPINMTYYNIGNYTMTVTDASGNQNYTFKNETFKFEDKIKVNKYKVTVNINNITITYGDCESVELTGNISNPPYGIKYNGKINILIGNHEYDNIEVANGDFRYIINIAEYDAGNYTILILEAEDNDNYTFSQATFKNNLTINKRTAEISNVNLESIVYASTNTIHVTGDITTTPYAYNYTGTITVTINGAKGQANAHDGKFNVTVNGIGKFNTGTYNVTVEGEETTNYNEILKNEDAKLEITKTDLSINDITINEVVYGKDLTTTIYGTVKSNVMIEGVNYTGEVTVTVKDKNITNNSHVLSNGQFAVKLDLGILPASKYTLMVTIVGDENYKTAQKEFDDFLTVIKDNATVLLDEIHVEYGIQDSITLNGNITKTGLGVNWNGRIDVNIGKHSYSNITVDNGTFHVLVDDISSFKAGQYDICIIDLEGNENYTLNKSTIFKNNLTINKKTVNVYMNNMIITYGDYPYVELHGHVSSSPYGVEYSGVINATINNHTYKNINVVNGNFTVNITDIADYDAGNYTIDILEAEDNDNYTFKQTTFKNNLTINKRTAEISNVNVESIVYASTNTIHITGDITTTPYAYNYTGTITVTINGIKGQANARNGKFNVTVNGVKKLNADKYNVSIKGEETVNYMVCDENASFEVVKANCSMETSITNVKIDQNATVSVILPNDATGKVIIIFNNTEYALDLENTNSIVFPIAPAGTYSVIISYDGDENYNPAETQIRAFTVSKYNASDLQNEINQAIANNQTELNLTHDYEFGENETTVTVNESIKINGNNHIVDANNSSGIFNITGDDVTLNNMTLINSNGIAIHSNGTNTSITNSDLENNNGTVIKIDGDNSQLNNNTISGNKGVGIEVNGENANLTDNEILNNTGHGIVINGGGAKISNMTFANNTGETGASILINGTNTTVANSTFKNNTAVNGSDIMITENANMTQDEINNLAKDNEINPAGIIQTPTMVVHMPENAIYCDDNFTITVIITDKNGKVRISIPNLQETVELTAIEGVINLELKNIPAGKYSAAFKYIPSKGYAQIPEITRELIVKNHSFSELQELINEAKDNNQSEIDLKHDYIFQDGDEVIKIPDNMKINGNGFTIDGNGKSGIFNITGDNVTISDLTLTHANASEGGAILWNGNNGTLQKATIAENQAINGSAVLWNGNDGRIIDTSFENNTAKESGAGAVLNGDKIIIDNSTFKNNKAETGAGIVANGENIKITNSQFLNNTANDGINNILVKENATINVDNNTRNASDSQVDVKITKLTVTSLTVNNNGVSISVKLNVPTGNVYANINGNRHYAKVTDGVATINILNLANGEYNADIIYPATESYTSAITNASFTIAKVITKIIGGKDITVYYLQGSKTTIRLIDNKGNPVNNANILFIVDGKAYNRNTDANGYATLKLNLAPGNHELYVSSDDDLITNKIIVKHIVNAKKTTTVKKSAKKTTISITVKGHNVKQTVDVKFTYKGANKIKVSFGKDMKKQTVTVKFKGKTYKVKVDAKGNGIIKLNKKLKKGKKYTAKVTYTGPKLYKNVKVTVKFNGKKYKVKTNKQGVAKFKVTKKMVKKLKKGKKVKYTITYKADKLNRYVKIK